MKKGYYSYDQIRYEQAKLLERALMMKYPMDYCTRVQREQLLFEGAYYFLYQISLRMPEDKLQPTMKKILLSAWDRRLSELEKNVE